VKHLDDLTCCRALFAGWVFTYHLDLQSRYADLFGPLGAVVHSGYLGVDGFFILSGMILAYSHPELSSGFADAKAFWAKRLVRIYPVHLAMILLLAALVGGGYLFHVTPREPERFGLDELLRHLALVHAWGFSDRWAWNYPSWSISAEWAGYLVFPFLWPWLRNQNATVLGLLLPLTLLGVVLSRHYPSPDDTTMTFHRALWRFYPEFIAGTVTMPLLRCLTTTLSGRIVAMTGMIWVLCAALFDSSVAVVFGLWCSLAGLMLNAFQNRIALLGRVPGLAWLGEISYSYYMSFALVETIQATIWRRVGVLPHDEKLIYIVTTTICTLGIATLAWLLVEKPALQAFAAHRRRRAALAVS
jgi:peptidoglycan/LPS O-acetylase OafA/YrhL